MARMVSYTKHENEVAAEYRRRVNLAESTDDVRAAFALMLGNLLTGILGEAVELDEGDVVLDTEIEAGYRLGPGLTAHEEFARLWEDSDLDAIIRRQAAMAVNRYKRLEGKPEQTDFKDRRPGKR
ncbi:MAG: hypothetical protein AB1916_00420 [Thermodesulfobacteriota bacterium]